MLQENPANHTAVSWHSVIAADFDASYRTNPNFKERFAVWSRLIALYGGAGKTGLDLGCGSGVFTLCLAKACGHVTAVDGSAEMLSLCQAKLSGQGIENVDFLNEPIEDAAGMLGRTFDVVTCSSVTEYLHDLDGALAAIASLVSPGGVLIISGANRRSLFRRVEPWLHKYIGRPRYYRFVKNVITRQDMTARLRKNGFDIVSHEFYAGTKLITPLLRFLKLREYGDNMYVLVCRKQG